MRMPAERDVRRMPSGSPAASRGVYVLAMDTRVKLTVYGITAETGAVPDAGRTAARLGMTESEVREVVRAAPGITAARARTR